MKYKQTLLLVFIFAWTGCFAADVAVRDHPGWYPAITEMKAAILKNLLQMDPEMELIDMSMRTDNGVVAMTTRREFSEGINQEFVKQALAGFLTEAKKSGLTVESSKPEMFGTLSGFRIVTSGGINPAYTISWMLFSRQTLYAIHVYDLSSPQAQPPVAAETEYLSRIEFSPSVQPVDKAVDVTRQPGYAGGYATAWAAMIVLAGGILVLFFRFVFRARHSEKPETVQD
jgi:hypothetical protein